MPRILITGAARGIGLALVKGSLARGWEVTALARDPAVPALLSLLEAGPAPGRLSIVACDVTDGVSVQGARAAFAGEALDILVSNAGVSCGPQRAPGFDFAATERVMATNAVGALRIYDAFIDLLRQGQDPKLVHISSEAGSLTRFRKSGKPDYAMSKAALNALTLWAAAEEPAVVVASLDPGWTKSQMGGENATFTEDETAERLLTGILALQKAHSGGFFSADLAPQPF